MIGWWLDNISDEWMENADEWMIIYLVGGWALPLWKIWARQLGWWHSQLFLESHSKFHGSSHHQPLMNIQWKSQWKWDLSQKDGKKQKKISPRHLGMVGIPPKKKMVMTWGWCKWQPGFTTLYGFIWIYMDLYGFIYMDLYGFSLIFPHLSYELQSTSDAFRCMTRWYDCLEVSINGATNRWMVYFMENPNLKSGWWFQSLWKIWARQLGWWHSQLFLESHSKFHGSSHHQPDILIIDYHY